VPDGTVIPAGGYLLVWADGEPEQNVRAGSARKLFSCRGGESIGLFAPDGGLVDSVTFGLQVDDLSEGRYADGGLEIHFLTAPTPGGPNAAPYVGDEAGPRIEPNSIKIVSGEIRFGWLSTVGKVYQAHGQFERAGIPRWGQPVVLHVGRGDATTRLWSRRVREHAAIFDGCDSRSDRAELRPVVARFLVPGGTRNRWLIRRAWGDGWECGVGLQHFLLVKRGVICFYFGQFGHRDG
jgi:hypothetical protein